MRMYTRVKARTAPAGSVSLVPMTRRVLIAAAAVLFAATLVLTAVALNDTRLAAQQHQFRPLAVGDCVSLMAESPQHVSSQPAPCNEDPSYTVGAIADASGDCPTTEYQHFPTADADTARLCLVPNLLAEHCYRLGMPIGVVTPAECGDPRGNGSDTGVLVHITQRLDVRDQRACPVAVGYHAWQYPSPARTYCTTTLH